jgi:hypothetical protein
MKQLIILLSSMLLGLQLAWAAEPAEIVCNIRDNGSNLSCQQLNSNGTRKMMTSEDISSFIDQGQIAAYITLTSRKGYERTYMVDGNSPQYKNLANAKKSSSMSEIIKMKSDLFNEIEKKLIKVSDDLDGQAAAAELIKYDPAVSTEKFRRDSRQMAMDLESARSNREKACATTATYEQMLKSNSSLQLTLSNILYAFQTPDSCMSDFKLIKDKDGAIDLRQLDSVPQKFQTQCRK